MTDTFAGSMARPNGLVSSSIGSVKRLLSTCLLSTCFLCLLTACNPANAPGASAAWTGRTGVDPITDAAVTTATTQVWDSNGAFLAEITLTCTTSHSGAAFLAAAVFFDNHNVGAPLLVLGSGPQSVAMLRVGDLDAIALSLDNLSATYSNQLFLLNGSTDAQATGALTIYSITSQLPHADRLLLKPTLTTGEPVFTINLAGGPVQAFFENCSSVFQHYNQLAQEEQARIQVQQEQANLYERRPAPAEAPPPAPPRREDFEQRAVQAEADCLRRYNVTDDPLDAAARHLCAETRDRWRQQFVNAASEYAFSVQTLHYTEFGGRRWTAETHAGYLCGQQYEAASSAAKTPAAADAAAQAAFECYMAATTPPPER